MLEAGLQEGGSLLWFLNVRVFISEEDVGIVATHYNNKCSVSSKIWFKCIRADIHKG